MRIIYKIFITVNSCIIFDLYQENNTDAVLLKETHKVCAQNIYIKMSKLTKTKKYLCFN